MTYRFIEHTADVGMEVSAETLPELFSEALRGMADVVTDVGRLERRLVCRIELQADALDELLLDFLTEALVRFETEGELCFGARLEIGEHAGSWSLAGVVFGEAFDPERHPPRVMIKAVTYHELSVERVEDGWRARVIFDI